MRKPVRDRKLVQTVTLLSVHQREQLDAIMAVEHQSLSALVREAVDLVIKLRLRTLGSAVEVERRAVGGEEH